MTDSASLIAEARDTAQRLGADRFIALEDLLHRLAAALEAATQWRPSSEEPEDGQEIVTIMKHGVISGTYDANEKVCRGYYWRDMEWTYYYWRPLPAPPEATSVAYGAIAPPEESA